MVQKLVIWVESRDPADTMLTSIRRTDLHTLPFFTFLYGDLRYFRNIVLIIHMSTCIQFYTAMSQLQIDPTTHEHFQLLAESTLP
jgi:hypothetical protein